MTTLKHHTQSAYWPDGVPWYFVRGGNNNVWHVNAINVRMQVPETYEAIGNNNTPSQMLFVSCPNWGVNPSNYGTYDICPHYNQTNDNGNLQGYAEYHGGPGYSSLLNFSQSFTYDNLNRLQTASDTGGWSRNFGYDRYGNMTPSAGTGNTIPLQGNSPTSFDATTNRMSLPDSSGTTYDSVGNQTHVNGNDVGYDVENRAISLAGGIWTYAFDGLGQRVQKSATSGVSTQFVYDAFGQLAVEYSAGTWARDYIHWGSGGGLIATENSSGPCTTCYFGFDHLGSIRLVMDQNANVIGRPDYLPYGEEIAASAAGRNSSFGPTNDNVTAKFTGQLRDTESGIDYFNARNFVGPVGRFTSSDPVSVGADLTDPQTWNGYAYVRNSPLHIVDPSGMAGARDDGGDLCSEDPFLCDIPPILPIILETLPPPPPATQTESRGGDPLPPGSFPNGEALGMPGGIGVPSTLQALLGVYAPDPFVFQVDPNAIELHHVFSEEEELARWFASRGINIQNYLIQLDRGTHRLTEYFGVHTNAGGNWNRAWRAYRGANPNATTKQIFAQARKMIKDFKIGEFPGASSILNAPVVDVCITCDLYVKLHPELFPQAPGKI